MKKIAAVLVVSTLLLASMLPAMAAWDRIPIQQMCITGQRANGTLIWKLKTVDCLPEWGGSCLPQTCITYE